ncbi:MAG: DUF1934 family protein [Firmicutes bacterium]|nr:DUF1934 family protein [Bacillota bacterium]
MTDAQTFLSSPGRVRMDANGQVTEVTAQIYTRAGHDEVRVRFEDPEDSSDMARRGHTVITLHTGASPSMQVRRFGPVESLYQFIPGQTSQGFLQVPEGRVSLQITTASVQIESQRQQVTVTITAMVEDQALCLEVGIVWADQG